jgi:competence protein ComEA
MAVRIGLFVGALVLAGFALWHPAPRPALQTAAAPTFEPTSAGATQARHGHSARAHGDAVDAIVYVAGAVHRPGLYHVRAGDRAADAVARAGGLTLAADAGSVNLAAHAADGDEIYVSAAGESGTHRGSAGSHRRGSRSHRRSAQSANTSLAPASIDVNAAGAAELAGVPGIGKAIAARIVEMRALDGSFSSLDELLDVTGMTQSRFERARPFLRPP